MPDTINTKSLAQFINLVDEYVTIVDKDLNIILANNNILSKLKYDHDEVKGQSISKFFKIFNQREIENLFDSVWNNKKTYCHIPFITKNSELIPVETKFKFPENENNDYVFLFSKELSHLNLNSDIFSTIFKTNPSLMCIMSLSNRTVVEVNDTFLSVLEFERKEVIDKKFISLALEFDDKDYKYLQKQIYKNATLHNIEVKVKTKSGITKYGNLSTELIYIEQEPCVLMVLADITEFKNSQLKLKRSERKYRDLTEMLPEMICEIDLDGKLIYANQFAIKKFGFTNENLKNTDFTIFNIFPHKEKELAKSRFYRAIIEGKQSSNEYTVAKKDGTQFPVIVYSSPIIENGIIKGIRGVMIDISERKYAEDQIKKNLKYQETISQISLKFNEVKKFNPKINEAFESIAHNLNLKRIRIYENHEETGIANCIINWTDKSNQSILKDYNEFNYSSVHSWEKILNEKGLITTNDHNFLPADVNEFFKEAEITSGIVLPMKICQNSSGFIIFENRDAIHIWQENDFLALKIISRIISNEFEKHRTEKDLITSEKENRAIIDSIPDIIFRFNKEGYVLSVKRAKESTPFIFKEINSSDYLENIFDKELATKILVAINVCLVSGQFRFDFDYPHNGITRYYEARFQKMAQQETIAIIRDVTEIKDHEKELNEARQVAEDASRAKSEFLANVSHEIRTPMNAILGFSEILLEKIDHPQYTSYLDTILSSGRTLLTLINDILDLSKIEAGKLEINFEPTSLNKLIKEMVHVFQHKASQKNLSLDYTIDESVPDMIYIDEVRLHQIIFNLVGNAIKYTEKGNVDVSCYAIKKEKQQEIDLFIEVVDTGIGIPQEQQDMIFQAFTQQSGQNNRKFEGTGLGLAIAQKLVFMLNGKIHLQSEAGEGSTFTVELNNIAIPDIDSIEIKTTKRDKQFEIDFAPAQIMIVDDVEYNIMILKSMIEYNNIEFIEAESGESALEILKTEKPDLIFMDLKMYGLSGYSTTEIIRKDPRLRDTPIIAFTASVMEDEIQEISSIFDGILRKPASRKQIISELKRFLKYKARKQAKPVVKTVTHSDTFSEKEKNEIRKMLKELHDKYIIKWKEIKDDLIMYELEDFSKELGTFIEPYPCNTIKEYQDNLSKSIQAFEIENVEKNITEFPKVLDKIDSILNQ